MAQPPKKSSKAKLSNIIGVLKGNFDFGNSEPEVAKPLAYGTSELISVEERSKILSGAFKAVDRNRERPNAAGALLSVVQSSLTKVTNDRLENRKILQLMPEVDKAARLMVASILSPNDLSRQEIGITFNCDDIPESYRDRLATHATSFFQKKLNLKTSIPSWIYQFGYESGSAVFAIVPLKSFKEIEDNSYIGTEAFTKNVIEPLCHDSFFGFGDSTRASNDLQTDIAGLESLGSKIINGERETAIENNESLNSYTRNMISKIIATESLNLTDNPSVLQVQKTSKTERDKRTNNILNQRFKPPKSETVVSVSDAREENDKTAVLGNPILLRLPPESVTVIHTPGEPNDHQGYLILLDHTGSPINALMQEDAAAQIGRQGSTNSVINQTFNAYGLGSGFRGTSQEETMGRIYTQIVSEHLRNRLGKAGLTQVEMGNLDSVFRCMFGRFLQQKQTRILYLPASLVTYMTFEMDQNGYGISRLEGIKFNLGLKMAVQISRVLAGIKAAMDRRKIEMKFTDNLMEQPEAVFSNLIAAYTNKQRMNFTVDPGEIQSQIAEKSISVKGIDMPGMETLDITNEPDQRTSSVDFDPAALEYLDKGILNGLRVPPSTMNSLGEDEYARSVATTNLFFSMDISVDQDVVIRDTSDLLRKYARFSEEFQKGIYDIFPELDPSTKKGKTKTSTDEGSAQPDKNGNDDKIILPDHYTIDEFISRMSITLPKPNVAPNKAQFEALDAMTTSITNLMNAIFPDELAGADDTLRPVVAMRRAIFASNNIRSYLESSGMSNIDIPTNNFSPELKELIELLNGLGNVAELLKDKAKLRVPAAPEGEVPGYT